MTWVVWHRKAGQVCGYTDFDHVGTARGHGRFGLYELRRGATSVVQTWPVPGTTTAGLTLARLRAVYRTIIRCPGICTC